MKDKVCLVTGANSGIGKATACALGSMGATVVMVCRDRVKGEIARKEILKQVEKERLSIIDRICHDQNKNPSVDLLIADLSSQQSIHKLVSEFTQRYDKLHVLVNNAGSILGHRTMTREGIETTFAVNHLAPFLLTNLLIDSLQKGEPSRVVTVSSEAHRYGSMDFDNLGGEKWYSGFHSYARSKLANVLFTYELARRLQDTRITANCLHPGIVRTNFGRSGSIPFRIILYVAKPFMISAYKGAQTTIFLASSTDVNTTSGKYFVRKRAVRSSRKSYDLLTAKWLWEISAELTNLNETV